MALELVSIAQTGIAHALVYRTRGSDGAFWHVGNAAWEAYSAAHIASYGFAATELASTGTYLVVDPTDGAAGFYFLVNAAGASLAASDLATGLVFYERVFATDANGLLKVDVEDYGGSAGTFSSGKPTVTVGTNNDKTGYSLTQAFPANFAALGIGGTGHISNVDTLTTYTGDTPQTGDVFARVGLAGVGLTNLGDARIAHLDADVSSRTKPADTQAAVGTVTNLTNAPTAGDLTATMKASVQAAADAAVTANALVLEIEAETDGIAAIPTNPYTGTPPTAAAISTQVGADLAAAHGSSSWVTATGFAIPGSQMTLQNGAITDAKFTVPSDSTGQATGILSMLLWLYERFFGKVVRDKVSTPNTIKTYQANGTTVRTTQVVTSNGTVDEVDAAT